MIDRGEADSDRIPDPGSRSPTSLEARGRRNLAALSVASGATDVASEMLSYLVPLYLTGVLGAKAATVGVIEGLASALASVLKAASGRLSDRWGRRRPLILAGYALSTVARPLFAIAGTPLAVAAVRWSDRVGKGLRTAPRDALLADGTPPGRRGRAFGVHRAADTAGAVIGVAIAVAVLGSASALDAVTFRTLALLAIVPGAIALATLVLFVRDLPAPAGASRVSAAATPEPRVALGRPFWTFLAIAAIFDLGDPAEAFLILRSTDLGARPGIALTLMLVANLVYAAAAAPAGRLSDRHGRRPLLVAGWCLHTVVYLGLGAVSSMVGLAAVLVAHGLRSALLAGALRAVVADLVPSARRGTAFGILAATLGVLDLPASWMVGLLWDARGPQVAFAVASSCGALAALLLAVTGVGRAAPAVLPFDAPG